MKQENFAFGKMNFILLGCSMLIVVLGFILMTGGSSDTEHFNEEIFSTMRTKVAPIVCLVGFLSIIGAIMYKPKKK